MTLQRTFTIKTQSNLITNATDPGHQQEVKEPVTRQPLMLVIKTCQVIRSTGKVANNQETRYYEQ